MPYPKVIVHREMPGAYGLGKVRVIYRPKPPKNYRKTILKLLAILVYSSFFSLMYLSYSWSKPDLKIKQTLPFLRNVLAKYDSFRDGKSIFFGKLHDPDHINSDIFKKGEKYTSILSKLNNNKVSDWVFIQEETEEKVLELQGYSHAKDRLLQLEFLRRFVSGTLSEVLGSHYTNYDKLSLTLGFKLKAREDYKKLSEQEKQKLIHYINGINLYLKQYTISYYDDNDYFNNPKFDEESFLLEKNLSYYFSFLNKIKYHIIDFFNQIIKNIRYTKALWSYSLSIPYDLVFLNFQLPINEFEPEDSLAILRLFLYEFGHDWEDELLNSSTENSYGKKISHNLLKNKNFNNYKQIINNLLSNNLDEIISPFYTQSSKVQSVSSIGGTVFGIGANKNKNNIAELAADMVLNNHQQNFLYPNKLTGGSLNITGLSLPGVPYILTGQNGHGISWTLSQNLDIDTEDLFFLKSDGETDLALEESTYNIEVTSFYGNSYESYSVLSSPSVGSDIVPILDENLAMFLSNSLNIKNVFLSSLSLKEDLNLQFLTGLAHANKIGSIDEANSLIHACSTLTAQAILVSYLDPSTGSVGIATTGAFPELSNNEVKNDKMLTLNSNNIWKSIKRFKNHHYLLPSADNVFVLSDSVEHGKNLLENYLNENDNNELDSLLLDSFSPSGNSSFPIIKKMLNFVSEGSNNDDEVPYNMINKLITSDFDGYYTNSSYSASLIEAMKLVAAKECVENLGSLQFFHLGSNITSISRQHKNYLIYQQNFNDILSYIPTSTSTTSSSSSYYSGYKFLKQSLQWFAKSFENSEWYYGNLHKVIIDHIVYKSTPLYDEILRFGDSIFVHGSHDSIIKSFTSSPMGLINKDTFYVQNNFISSHRIYFNSNKLKISLPYTNNMRPSNLINNIDKFNSFMNETVLYPNKLKKMENKIINNIKSSLNSEL